MQTDQDSIKPPTVMVFWIIWFAILQGLVLVQFLAGGGIPSGEDAGKAPGWVMAVAGCLALVALGIRFTLIPRLTTFQRLLPAMVVGLAFSEAIGFLGMFGVGRELAMTRLSLFILSLCCLVSLAPVYVKAGLGKERF